MARVGTIRHVCGRNTSIVLKYGLRWGLEIGLMTSWW